MPRGAPVRKVVMIGAPVAERVYASRKLLVVPGEASVDEDVEVDNSGPPTAVDADDDAEGDREEDEEKDEEEDEEDDDGDTLPSSSPPLPPPPPPPCAFAATALAGGAAETTEASLGVPLGGMYADTLSAPAMALFSPLSPSSANRCSRAPRRTTARVRDPYDRAMSCKVL
jgi:hypothetical protein